MRTTKLSLLVSAVLAGQQIIGQDRRDGDRREQRGEDRDDVGDAERREQPPLDAGQRKQRHEHQHDDHRRVDDAGADLLARRRDHLQDRAGFGRGRGSPAAAAGCSRRPTTASSTSSPMAIARPPSVIVLMVRPKAWNTSTVIRIDIGMAVSETQRRARVHQEHEQDHRHDDGRLEQHALRRC